MADISETILDDLCSRFLVNLPAEELGDPIRACFQIELAYWFYTDFYKSESPKCGLREFIRKIFFYLPSLQQYSSSVDEVIDKWRKYKSAVPTYGAILVDESGENVLLVQGFYATSRWGFPKGKVNEDEPPHVCAIREVKEETGFDISSLIDPELYLERTLSDTVVRLYLVIGVPKSYTFHPETRNEIKNIKWFSINDLPVDRHDNSKNAIGVYANNFFHVIPFVNFIKEWVRVRNGLVPAADSSKKINNNNRPYSPGGTKQTMLNRSTGGNQFGRNAAAKEGRFSRQRTQSLNVAVVLNDNKDNNNETNGLVMGNNYDYVNSINSGGSVTIATNGFRSTAAVAMTSSSSSSTTPKFTKQQKKQKNTPKQRLFNDDVVVLPTTKENGENREKQQKSGSTATAVGNDVYLAKVWQNVCLDWNNILKDL